MNPKRTEQRTSEKERDDAKRAVARAFDRAIDACDYSLEQVGNLLGVDESRVRRLRSADKKDINIVPNAADILLADHLLGERFLAELTTERLARYGAAPTVTVEQKLFATMGSAAALVGNGVRRLSDGKLTGSELPETDGDAAGLMDDLGDLRAEIARLLGAGRR